MTARSTGTAYEVTVAGPLGPSLRAAFAEHCISAIEPCAVLRIRVSAGHELDLVDLVGLCESAGLQVEGLYRSSASSVVARSGAG